MQVLDKLTQARLVTASKEGFEVAHEALIRTWVRLQNWFREDRELILWRRRLYPRRQAWQQNRGELLRGSELNESVNWLAKERERLGPAERTFIERSRRAARRRSGVLMAVAAAMTVAVCSLGGFAWLRGQRAYQAGILNMARSAPLAVGALLVTELPEQIGSISGAVVAREIANALSPHVVLEGHGHEVTSASFSPDGTRIVTTSRDKTARVWDANGTCEPVVLKGHGHEVTSASFSPDGTRIVTVSSDKTARVWRAEGAGDPVVLRGHASIVVSASFSPDGTRIVTASSDKTARIWRYRWSDLRKHLSKSVTGCLSVEQRKRYLSETDSEAADAYDKCCRTKLKRVAR